MVSSTKRYRQRVAPLAIAPVTTFWEVVRYAHRTRAACYFQARRAMNHDDIFYALGHAPGFLNIISTDNKLLWCSRISYGLDPSILGLPADTITVAEDKPLWQEMLRRAVHNREVSDFRTRVNVPVPPGWVTINGRMAPVIRNDRVEFVVTVCYDATFRADYNPAVRFLLSPLERSIVSVLLATPGPLKSNAIAARVGESRSSSRIRTILASLVERGILAATWVGYSLSEDFRLIAMDLLR